MVQSFFVYGIMLLSMIILGINSSNHQVYNIKIKSSFWGKNTIGIILIFSIISGLRYDVGVDYLGYLSLYQDTLNYKYIDHPEVEIGFLWILNQFANIKAHYFWVFGFFAFIQIFFIYYAFKNERYLYPFLPFILLTSGIYFTLMNEIRQSIDCTILIYAIHFAKKEKAIQYALLTFLALLFHQSALLLIPLFFFISSNKDFFNKIWLQILLLLSAMLLSSSNSWNYLMKQISLAINLLNYSEKYGNIDSRISIWQHEYEQGFRYYGTAIIFIAIIIYSKKMKAYFTANTFIKYYNLFFIGVLLYFITYQNTLMQRPARYFTSMQFVISSYFLFYLWKYRRKSYLNLATLIIIILVHLGIFIAFVASDHHTYYQFFWER